MISLEKSNDWKDYPCRRRIRTLVAKIEAGLKSLKWKLIQLHTDQLQNSALWLNDQYEHVLLTDGSVWYLQWPRRLGDIAGFQKVGPGHPICLVDLELWDLIRHLHETPGLTLAFSAEDQRETRLGRCQRGLVRARRVLADDTWHGMARHGWGMGDWTLDAALGI